MRILTILLSTLFICGAPTMPVDTSTGTASPIKYIYLTFDDGPLQGSENIDSVILAERLKISAFLVGEHARQSQLLGTYYKMYEQNPFVETYNHSFTHANNKYALFYSKPDSVLKDIQKNEAFLNLNFKIVRLPGRNIWRIGGRKRDDGVSGAAAADLLAAKGFKLFGWDLEWQHKDRDGTPIQPVAVILNDIRTRLATGNTFTKDHIVVLLHDEMFRKKWEESELKQLIDSLRKDEHYVFEHVRFYPDK